MDKPIVWFIDENPDELRSYVDELRHLLPLSIHVKGLPPLPRKEDYFETILSDPDTACVLIDQKLKGTGANYLGIELAQALRQVNRKIPIYILTNWAQQKDQFTGSEWSVEDIIAKHDLIEDGKARIIISRMLRRIDVYKDMLADREQRFNDLLRKSLMSEFTSQEKQELEELQFERSAPVLAAELGRIDELDSLVQRYKDLLQQLRDSQSLPPTAHAETPNVEQ